jgi:4'-phosphopantetheinyl transferase EntD
LERTDLGNQEEELSRRLLCLAKSVHPTLKLGCRTIRISDEFGLFPEEAHALTRAVPAVRRASGAGRLVARELLANLGSSSNLVRRGSAGEPQWPSGFVGSIAHDSEFAVAAVTTTTSIAAVGLDVEPKIPLPPELLEIIATPNERAQIAGDMVAARLLFCMKEAVYKATFPHDGLFLEHHDVEIQFDTRTARTRSGHSLKIYTIGWPRLVALTVVPVS